MKEQVKMGNSKINICFNAFIMRLFFRFFFFLSLILDSLTSCTFKDRSGVHYEIKFVNNSDIDIFVSKAPYVTDDSLCYEIMQTYNNHQSTLVKAHSENAGPLHLGSYKNDYWENYLSRTSGTVIIYVHDAEISERICSDKNINWNYMNEREKESLYSYLNEQIVIKRYFITLEYLEGMDWTITYP